VSAFPNRDELHVLFAHVAYALGDCFAGRKTGITHREARDFESLKAALPEADVLVVSGLWRNELLEVAPRLRFVQSIAAGTDQFSREALRTRGIRLASAQGGNERAVAEHAIGLILAWARQLHLARDNQSAKHWRGMIGDRARREEEIGGKTLLIVGLGRIGSRLARLARAFDMKTIGVKRDATTGGAAVDEVVPTKDLAKVLPRADYVALTCPLTDETRGLIDARALAAMKPAAVLINVARGRVVDEPALIAALGDGRIRGAALDCFWDEPMGAASPLWPMPNVIITPHSAGETRAYEDNVVDLLLDNLDRLWRGETTLRNQIV
jgi:phosphoglycerate dehydrogenase-like enzyme